MIKVVSSAVRNILAAVSVYSRKISSTVVLASITAITTATPKKLVLSYSNKLAQASTINKRVAVSYSNIIARVITGPYSAGTSLSDSLNISSAATVLIQSYADNASYFLEDYVGSYINITQ